MRTLLLIFFLFKEIVHLYAADSSIVEEPIILRLATGAVSGTITLPAKKEI
jgi:hypothetical protein